MIGVTKRKNLERVGFFIYDDNSGKFELNDVQGLYCEDCEIRNIIVNDINNNSYMDIVITVFFPNENRTETQIYFYDEKTQIYKKEFSITGNNGNFLMGDFNGDSK